MFGEHAKSHKNLLIWIFLKLFQKFSLVILPDKPLIVWVKKLIVVKFLLIEFCRKALNWCDVWREIKICSYVAFENFGELTFLNCKLEHRLRVFDFTELKLLIHFLKSVNLFFVPVQRELFVSPLFVLNTVVKNPLCCARNFNEILNFLAFRVMVYKVAKGYCGTCKATVFFFSAFCFESSTYVLVDSFETSLSTDMGWHWVWDLLLHLVLLIIFNHFIVCVDIIFHCTLRSCLLNFTWFIYEVQRCFLCLNGESYILHTIVENVIKEIDIASIIYTQIIFFGLVVDENVVYSSSSINWVAFFKLCLAIFLRLSVGLFRRDAVLGLKIV